MTTPTRIQVDRWLCPHCQQEHTAEAKAVSCCLCRECNKNRAAVSTWGGGKPDICAPCNARKQREKARNDVRTAQARVDRARGSLADAERALVIAQTKLAALHTARDAKHKKSETQESP